MKSTPTVETLYKKLEEVVERFEDAEREGIVQKCVQAVQQVIASGYRFSEPDSVSVARSRYQAVNSTVISFADECLCPWPDDKINDSRCSTGTIYKVYVAWCKDNNNGSTSATKYLLSLFCYFFHIIRKHKYGDAFIW